MFRYTVIALLFIIAGSRGTMFCTGGTCVTKPLSLKDTFAELDESKYMRHPRAILPSIPDCIHNTSSHLIDYPEFHIVIPRHILLEVFSLPSPTYHIISTRPPRIP